MKEEYILFSFTWEIGVPNFAQIAERFDFSIDDIDSEYGIVEIDEEENLYCILVSQETNRPQEEDGQHYSNPRISPFDLEQE